MEEIDFEKLKRAIKEGTKQEKKKEVRPRVESVDEIVHRVLKKYEEEGLLTEGAEEEFRPLEQLITPSISISGSPEDLARSKNAIVRLVGRIYLALRTFFDRLAGRIFSAGFIRRLDLALYAARMPFTGLQYAIFSLVLSVIVAALAFTVGVTYAFISGDFFAPLLSALLFIAMLGFLIYYPYSCARMRAVAAEKQLPYALRHLAVILRSGAGFYQALKMVAAGDYGVLSEELRRTVREIDEGKTTREALSNLAVRMRGSRGIRRAVAQLLRALRVGGRISDVITEIARDVAFEQRAKISQYGERLNVFGIFFMFLAVVFPVMLAMLCAVGYAPVARSVLSALRVPIHVLQMLYFFALPAAILLYIRLIRAMDPMR